MNKLTQEQISALVQEARERSEKALGYTFTLSGASTSDLANVENNADFIAYAKLKVPALCDAVAQLQQENAEMRKLLQRAADCIGDSHVTKHDPNWWRDYFLNTGQHMILTEEGWQPGECKQELVDEYGEDHIQDEVNAPESL